MSCAPRKPSIDEVIAQEKIVLNSIKNKDFRKTIETLDEIIAYNPAHPMAYRLKADAHLQLNEDRKALRSIQSSIALNSGDLRDYILYADILERTKKIADATEVLKEAIDTLPHKSILDIESISADYIRYSPIEVELFAKVLELLQAREGVTKETLSYAELGFNRNSGSRKLFDIWMGLLARSGDSARRENFLHVLCSNPAITESNSCKLDNESMGSPISQP